MTDTLVEQPVYVDDHALVEFDEKGEQRLTHIVNCPPEYDSTGDYLMAAIIEGFSVEALCGEVFQPVRDPKKYPVCDACIDEAERIQSEVFNRG